MRQIRSDLWETRAEGGAPGPTTHAYLWTPPSGENVLFYSVASDADFDRLDELGGVTHQYLSHEDEAGPPLQRIRDRFGARLHAPAAEADAIGRFASIDEPLERRHVDANRVEVVPTPGHTPGSTSYVVTGADGERYLFTGDTLFRSGRGNWRAGYIAGYSDAPALADSLAVLGRLEPAPDLIISSAFMGDSAVHERGDASWARWVQEASDRLPGTEAAAR